MRSYSYYSQQEMQQLFKDDITKEYEWLSNSTGIFLTNVIKPI